MTSTVEAISDLEVYGPASSNGKATDAFSNAFRISAATELLKSTGQFEKWQVVSQKSDAEVAILSDMVIERHTLLEQARGGRDVDWNRFDQLTDSLAQKGIHLYSSGRIKSTVQLPEPIARSIPAVQVAPAGKESVAAAVSEVRPLDEVPSFPPDMDEMVLEMRCGDQILTPALLGYGDESRILLPLVQISRIASFNISAEAETGRIEGWFLEENRRLKFDPGSGVGSVEGRPITLPQERYMAGEDDLYVDSRVLSDWFPVDFDYDFSSQSVVMAPREALPFQESMARAKAMKQFIPSRPNEAQLPLKTSEYRILDPMFMDVGLSLKRESNSGKSEDDGSFYFLGAGDLGFMNSELYVTGDEDDTVNAARLTLMREDSEAGLIGPLKATKVSIGDIQIPSFPVLGGAKFERGVYLGNLPLNSTGEYDTTRFSGSLAPGWDAQLYRNGILLDSQRAGEEGRYTFEEVPLYYGTNEFTLKFYGPQGQEKEKTERVVVGSDMIRKGRSEYQLSVTQKDGKLFDPLDSPETLDRESTRILGRFRYGLMENLSVQGGIQSQAIDGETHTYFNAGIQTSVKAALLSADVVRDTAGGTAVEMLGQKKIGEVNFKVKQQFFDDFTREGETDLSNKTTSKTEVSAFGVLPGKEILPDIPFSLTLKHTDREHSEEKTVGARLTAGINNTYISNYLQWKEESGLVGDDSKAEGRADLTANLGRLRLLGDMNYELYPDSRVNQARISGLYNFNRELSSELAVADNFENDNLVTGSLGVNWNNGNYILSPRFSYDSNGEFTAALSFSTSFGMDGRSRKAKFTSAREAGQGAVSARVYHDRNSNRIFDKGDVPIPGAEVTADQAYKSAATDDDGFALLTGLAKHRRTDITLERDSLEDPFWEPAVQGNSILPRPGHVEHVDIPVMSTGEIDGYLYMEKESGLKKTLNHVPIQLVDAYGQVVQELKTEYDGFYLFMKVPPGDYEVRMAPEFAKNLGIALPQSKPVAIGSDGEVAAGHDLVYTPLSNESKSRVFATAGPAVQESERTVSVERTAAVDPVPAAGDTPPDPPVRFGLHVSSYKTMASAVRGISYQRARQAVFGNQVPFTVQKTDLGPEKGIWYRVFAGSSGDMQEINALSSGLEYTPPYTRMITLKDSDGGIRTGIHMASYRTRGAALKGIQQLKSACPPLLKNREFSFKLVDLGPDKGSWYRVVATGFADRAEARTLMEKLSNWRPYSKPMAIEKSQGRTVHTASYRSYDKAVAHLEAMSRELGPRMPDQASVRPVDLGKKGRWYRVVLGEYDRTEDAASLMADLKGRGDYANVIPLI